MQGTNSRFGFKKYYKGSSAAEKALKIFGGSSELSDNPADYSGGMVEDINKNSRQVIYAPDNQKNIEDTLCDLKMTLLLNDIGEERLNQITSSLSNKVIPLEAVADAIIKMREGKDLFYLKDAQLWADIKLVEYMKEQWGLSMTEYSTKNDIYEIIKSDKDIAVVDVGKSIYAEFKSHEHEGMIGGVHTEEIFNVGNMGIEGMVLSIESIAELSPEAGKKIYNRLFAGSGSGLMRSTGEKEIHPVDAQLPPNYEER